MENFNLDQAKDIKDVIDIADVVKKIVALQRQLNNPTRDRMIAALADANLTAGAEIQQIEQSHGNTVWMPWACFSDQDLYGKLSYYQTALRQHCIKKVGEKTLEEMLKVALKGGTM